MLAEQHQNRIKDLLALTMVIHGDGRETIFNAFQVQIEFWMRISNFFEVRESFVCFRVNSRFTLFFIVRHCCYPPRRATKPRWGIPCFEVVLKVYSWN